MRSYACGARDGKEAEDAADSGHVVVTREKDSSDVSQPPTSSTPLPHTTLCIVRGRGMSSQDRTFAGRPKAGRRATCQAGARPALIQRTRCHPNSRPVSHETPTEKALPWETVAPWPNRAPSDTSAACPR